MRRWLVLAALWVAFPATVAHAQPVRDGKQLLSCPDPLEMLIAVATARSLHGPWQSRVLYFRGQFNALTGEQENYGGVIDPSVVRDGTTGQLYLFWAEQHSSIWVSQLSPDGLTMSPNIHKVMWTQPGWECRTPRGTCVSRDPRSTTTMAGSNLFYSGASTWTGSYAIGVAASQDPLVSQFQRLDSQPALRSGNGYVGPGGSSAPVLGPDGRTYIFYHALSQPDPDHASAARYLFSSPIRWAGLGGYDPVIGSGQVDLRTAHRLAPPAPVRAQSGGRHRTARASGDRQRSESSHSTMRAPISAPASS